MDSFSAAIGETVISEGTQQKTSATETARDTLRAFFELAKVMCAAFAVVVILASVMRATESFIIEKLMIPEAHAASLRDGYTAKLMIRTGAKISMEPGETLTYRVGFKNTGAATWQNGGEHFLSIYTYDPKYRESDFYHPSWRLSEQPAVMSDQYIQPGMVGFFDFVLQAPQKTGTYKESFHLAAEELLWIPGGEFTIEITVEDAPIPVVTSTPASTNSTPTAIEPNTDGYGATLLLRSHKEEVFLGPGEQIEMTLAFKNSGTKPWGSHILRQSGVMMATTTPTFHHLSWAGANDVIQADDEVLPGRLVFFKFTLQAPQSKGSYRPVFKLVVDDVTVPGGEVDIPITVTADGQTSSPSASVPAVQLISEPEIRVGLFKTTAPIMIMADGDYDVWQDGVAVQTVRSGQPSKIIFDFDYHTYTVNNSNGTVVYQKPVRLVTQNPDGVFSITSYENRTGWNPNLNDNRFRRSLEVYLAENTGNLWVINELPMELYLRGLAETSDYSHAEFQKALATAARTYAFYHWTRNTKHGGHFHVDATYDQVYRGYGNEIRTPTFTNSVEATRGSIVTYGGEIALTPYYSRSDGRTRDWTEVWGGAAKPWLVSVPAPYDQGQTLWGHGVGMSARDALYRARAGALWQDIVTYYYQNTQIVKQWQ